MVQQKTPGVYIEEIDAFPNSVVEVPTGVAAFLGYTEKAVLEGKSLTGSPTRVSSLEEYHSLFGGGAAETFSRKDGAVTPSTARRYLYPALQMFFQNGGGECWIISIGDYDAPLTSADFSDKIWGALRREGEPALLVAPDAVALDWDDYKTVTQRMVKECAREQNRFAILDLYSGAGPDLKAAIERFRGEIELGETAKFAAVYAPWLNTNVTQADALDLRALDMDSRTALKAEIEAEQTQIDDALLANLVKDDIDEATARSTHKALIATSTVYAQAAEDVLAAVNLLPPAGAIAGIYARTDAEVGVWQAPANTTVNCAISPAVDISNEDQEDMNIPLFGKAVNAIRSFPGRGVLVWGARTLDGNSQDWRYVNVRRTMIMLEQSISIAAQAYVFSPNTSATWIEIQTMIQDFLHNQWKAGALQGNTPADAYSVDVGLGSTMVGNDILDGYMRVTVRVAVSYPADFMVITFQQKMMTS